MADLERRVVETESTGVNEQGDVSRETLKSVHTSAGPKTAAVNAVWYVYGVIAILLALRLALKLFGANSANGFVDFIYSVSSVLVAPFNTIFGVAKTEAGNTQSIFEPSIIVAALVYALIAWGIAKLLTLNEKN